MHVFGMAFKREAHAVENEAATDLVYSQCVAIRLQLQLAGSMDGLVPTSSMATCENAAGRGLHNRGILHSHHSRGLRRAAPWQLRQGNPTILRRGPGGQEVCVLRTSTTPHARCQPCQAPDIAKLATSASQHHSGCPEGPAAQQHQDVESRHGLELPGQRS